MEKMAFATAAGGLLRNTRRFSAIPVRNSWRTGTRLTRTAPVWNRTLPHIIRTQSIRACASQTPTMSEAERAARDRGEPTMVRAQHILVESEAMVDALKAQLDSASFESLAKSMSTCPSKDKGGDIGWFKRYQMVPEFERACFDNRPGTIVKCKTQFGWHLIRVTHHGTSLGTISVRELADRKDEEEIQRIDVRERTELKLANLGDAFMNLPMGEYAQWAQDFEDGKLGLDKKKETVVLCHHGVRSNQFCQFLYQQGFEKVRNIVGGIDLYSKEIDDTVPRY